MEFHDIVVICDINPTSTAEFCEVFARNDDPRVKNRESMLTTYINLFVCMYMHMCGNITCMKAKAFVSLLNYIQ